MPQAIPGKPKRFVVFSVCDLLTKREAAARLRITVRTLENYVAAGQGPTMTRIGGKLMVRTDHLEAWIEQRAEPRAQPGRRPAAMASIAVENCEEGQFHG